MELSTLVFKADTTELERASKAVEQLTRDFAKVSISAQQAAKIEAQTQEIISRALLNDAKARKESAAAIDREIKTRIAADTADKKNEESKRKSTAATEKSTEASKKNVSILERQTDILKFQTEGWSKGQSSILATAKAAGVAAEEMQKLQEILATQRKLMGTDPFDKSLSGLTSLKNQYTELKEAMRQYNSDSGLTAKQTRELSRDKERLIERMKSSGASFQEIRQAMRAYNTEYSALAGKLNQAAAQEAEVIKARKNAASATEYLTQQDQKMAAALNTSNAAIDKSGSDLLVKYENSLRKAGVAQDVATKKLATYKAQLEQVQAQEELRRGKNLARALSPQLTDIAVSLYSGQAPLTVMLQQSGQILDLFTLSGVKAEEFSKTLKNAFASMLPAMATVAKGMGEFVISSLVDAGNAVVSFAGKITGISAGMEAMKRQFAASGEAGFGMIGMLNKMTTAFAAVATGGIVILITTLVALAVEYKNIIASENALSTALNLSGASLGMTKDQVISYAQSLGDVAGGTLKASEALTAFIKVGDFTKEQLGSLTQSAVLAQKAFGTSLEDIAKEYQKLQEKPTEALTDIAIKTGEVTQQTLEQVRALEAIGDKQAAAKLATEAAQQANDAAAKRQLAGLSPIEKLWNDIKQGIVNAKEAIYDIAKSDVVVFALRAAWATLVAPITTVWGVLQGVGKAIGGVAAVAIEFIQGNYTKAWGIAKEVGNDAIDGLVAGGKKVVEMFTGVNDAVKDAPEMAAARKQQSEQAKALKENAEAINAAQDKQLVWAQKQKHLQEQRLAGLLNEVQYNAALDGWKEKILGKEKKTNNNKALREREKEVDVLNKLNDLTASYNNDLQRLQNLRERGVLTEEEYVRYVEELVAKQPFAIKFQKEINDAHELENKLLGTADRLGKDYYSTREKILTLFKDEVTQKKLLDILDANTPAAKEKLKLQERRLELERQINEELRQRAEVSRNTDLKLDMRVELLGKTSEQQKYIRIEQERELKVLDAKFQLEKKIEQLRSKKDKKDLGYTEEDFTRDVKRYQEDYAEKVRLINKETAIIYAEDLNQEIANIRSGITDSIVAALFEGGKEGGKKLRDVLLGTLRKKVTIVVDAVVNTVLGNVIGQFAQVVGLGGSGLGGGGGILGAASNAASIGNTLGLFGGGGIFGTSAAYSAAVPGLTLGSQQATMLASQTGVFGAQGLTATASAGGGSALGSALGAIGTTASAFGTGAAASFTTMVNAGVTGWATAAGSLIGSGSAAGIAAGLGMIAAPLVAVAALWKPLFGRKLKDSGIEATFGSNAEGGSESRMYKFYKGGVFRSDKTEYEKTASELEKFLDSSATAVKEGAKAYAEALRLAPDALDTFSITLKESFKGLDEQQVKEKVAEMLQKYSNGLAETLLGSFDEAGKYTPSEFARDGEAAGDTLARLGGSLMATNKMFDMLGASSYEASLAGADMASQLIDQFGGLEQMVQSTGAYFQAFHTPLEQLQYSLGQMDKTFADLGLSVPQSRAAFRKLVEAQDLTTSSGRKTYAALMALAPAFDQMTDSLYGLMGVDPNSIINTLKEGILSGDMRSAGKQISDMLVGGIHNALATSAASQIYNIANQYLIQPLLNAIITGQSIEQLLLDGTFEEGVGKMETFADNLATALNDPRIAKGLEAIGKIGPMLANALAPVAQGQAKLPGASGSSSFSDFQNYFVANAATNQPITQYSWADIAQMRYEPRPTATADMQYTGYAIDTQILYARWEKIAREGEESLKESMRVAGLTPITAQLEDFRKQRINEYQEGSHEYRTAWWQERSARMGKLNAQERLEAFKNNSEYETLGHPEIAGSSRTIGNYADYLVNIRMERFEGGYLSKSETAIKRAEVYAQVLKELEDSLTSATELQEKYLAKMAEIPPELQKVLDAEEKRLAGEQRISLQKELDELMLTSAQLRERERDAIHESNLALYDAIQLARTQKALAEELPALLYKLATPEQQRVMDYDRIASGLDEAGISVTGTQLASMSMDQIISAATAIYQMGETSDETRLALVRAVSSIADLQDAVTDTTDALKAQTDAVTQALNVRNTAGSLLDQIDKALGGSGDQYRRIREAELWAAIEVADYKQQIDLASQLTDIVLERQNKEIESAKKQLDFAKQLKSFVASLKVGNLSPLTTAERLSEAQKQYYETLAKAQAGDEKAQSDLQGKVQTYLDLARTYYASSPDYTAIFESVTGALDSFGFSAETDAQKQLAATNGSNEKLTQLKSILERAYEQADLDYQGQKTLLQQQLTHLASTDNGVLLVANILKELPAEIAALMNSVIAGKGIYDPTTDSGVSGSGVVWNGENLRDSVREHYAAGGDMKEIYDLFKQEGYTLKQVDSIMQFPAGTAEEWAKSIGLPIYHSGIDYVPQTGPALLQRGERVISARNNAAMDFGALIQSNQLLREELQDVKAELVQLREENREDARMQVNATVQSNLEAAETVSQGMQKAEYSKNLNKKAVLV